MKEVFINTEPIELFKLLKFDNLVASGAEAKNVIADGLVQVNGNVETQKRKKIFAGDMIDFQGAKMLVRLEQ